MNTRLDILVSERFLKNYRRSNVNLQKLTEGAVHDLVNLYKSDSRIVSNNYDKLAHCKARIIEIDISGANRLLADYSENRITLLNMGDHDVPKRYTDHECQFDLMHAQKAPAQFYPEQKTNFFSNCPDKTVYRKYQDEMSAEWLYVLEKEQAKILEELEEKFLYTTQDFSTFIVGGPGTGKTCILLNLLKFCTEFDYRVGISISDEVMNYIEAATDADIARYRVNLKAMPELDLLLVDDPSHAELMQALELKKSKNAATIVAGFDPLQIDEAISDQDFGKICYDNKIEVRQLTQCYRQKENLGKNTKQIVEIIADSTPFVAEHKIQAFRSERKKLTNLSNNLEFVNPNGYLKTYENTTIADVRCEVNCIWNARELMWDHCQGLLILLGKCQLSSETEDLFKMLKRRNYVKTITFDENKFEQVNKIKGLEFQHVFAFINKNLYDELQNGFRGTGQNVYKQRRLLRIPFSRAKDSLVTFAIDDV